MSGENGAGETVPEVSISEVVHCVEVIRQFLQTVQVVQNLIRQLGAGSGGSLEDLLLKELLKGMTGKMGVSTDKVLQAVKELPKELA